MFLRSRSIFVVFLLGLFANYGIAQSAQETKPESKKTEKVPVAPTPAKAPNKALTAEQIVESSIFVYGFPGGRATLNQIRKTTFERGQSSLTNAEGKVEQVPYRRYIIRADKLEKEKVRLDQEFPSARYSLVFSDEKIFGIYNNAVFSPREDAAKGFENQIIHGLEALLRHKENESVLELADRVKIMGVDYYVLNVTDKLGRKTSFYVSSKTFRVMMLTYEENGVRYRRKFYDYNYAQGTLVPFRSVLWADDKIVEETEVGTITFGQKVDEDLFKAGS